MFFGCFRKIILFILVTSSCTSSIPERQEIRSPINFIVPEYIWEQQGIKNGNIRFLQINSSSILNRKLINSWESGLLTDRFQQIHPLVEIFKTDIETLQFTLNELSLVYYANEGKGVISKEILSKSLKERMHCVLMSKNEVLFFSGDMFGNSFSKKKMTLLEISAQQLMLYKGFQAIYSNLASNYFPQYAQNRWNPIGIMDGTEVEKIVRKQVHQGFVLCRPLFYSL